MRRPFAARTQDCARENGLLCTLNYPGLAFPDPVSPAVTDSDDEGSHESESGAE